MTLVFGQPRSSGLHGDLGRERGRRVAQQFAREAGQHTGPRRRRQRAPGRSLQQAKEPDIEIEERCPGRHRQREMSDQVGGASGERLETGQLAGEPESGSRPTPRGQPHRVDGLVGQIRHQHGQFPVPAGFPAAPAA